MTVKLSSALPDEECSGVHLLQDQLVRKPDSRHVLVMVVDCGKQTTEFGSQGRTITPTMRVLYVEPMCDEEDINDAVRLIGAARGVRLNRTELDFEGLGVGDPFESLARSVIDDIYEHTQEQEDKAQEQDND